MGDENRSQITLKTTNTILVWFLVIPIVHFGEYLDVPGS